MLNDSSISSVQYLYGIELYGLYAKAVLDKKIVIINIKDFTPPLSDKKNKTLVGPK